jgi:hydroxymethylpyrimidine/phosphomethylpyrimidine kinase
MLATEEAVESLARAVGREGLVKWVIDPVMVSATIYIYILYNYT